MSNRFSRAAADAARRSFSAHRQLRQVTVLDKASSEINHDAVARTVELAFLKIQVSLLREGSIEADLDGARIQGVAGSLRIQLDGARHRVVIYL